MWEIKTTFPLIEIIAYHLAVFHAKSCILLVYHVQKV